MTLRTLPGWLPLFGALMSTVPAVAQVAPTPQYPALPSETPAMLEPKTDGFDYARRDAMIRCGTE